MPDTTQDYKGQRLGLPADGKGAVAGVGRRLAAITVDWFAAVFISRLLFPGVDYATQSSSIVVLGTFAVVVIVLTWLSGASLGQRLLGIQVVKLGANPRPGLGTAVAVSYTHLTLPTNREV